MADVFDSVRERVKTLAGVMNLTKEEQKLLLEPHHLAKKELDIDGEKLPAWRIVSNNALGPGKGGIRFHPEVTEGEVKSLSFWMALKNSLAGLPYGGGKGGVRFNPKGKSPEYLEKVSRAYAKAFYKVIGQDIDVPAPDVYTNGQIMSWILDEYETLVGHHEPGMLTGKPVELGGIAMRGDATSRGGYIVLKEMTKSFGLDGKKLTVAIQGFGNAGENIARMIDEDKSFKILAVSDSKGGIYNKTGLNYKNIAKVKKEKGSVVEVAGQKVSNSELLELEVDILVLAALENQITEINADKIKARYIIELANGPVNPKADEILWKQKVVVVPDILANSGGVITSYFEWVQNKCGQIFDEDFLVQRLVRMMTDSWNKVYGLFEEKNKELDLRTCAYIIALTRILSAEKYRGRIK